MKPAHEAHVCGALDFMLGRLELTRQILSERAVAFGAPAIGGPFSTRNKSGTKASSHSKSAGALTAKVINDCKACTRKLHALLQTANAIDDSASTHIAYVILRTLDKLLWLLRSYLAAPRLAFSDHFSGQFQLQASTF